MGDPSNQFGGLRETVVDRDMTRLIVVCGLPGAGKTTVAREVVDRTDARLIRTDVVRKEIITEPTYTAEETTMVYEEAFDRARETLQDGTDVVIDATFRNRDFRIRALETAEEVDAEFRLVRVVCEEDVVRRRIQQRVDDASDADFEVHQMFRETFDRVALQHDVIDNSETLTETRRQVGLYF